jgi:cell fate (sporulation/competence/biofilm development) regulator YlbF (YheA/YmcA/DUF963 family)
VKTLITTILLTIACNSNAEYNQFIDMQNEVNILQNRGYQPQPTGDQFIDTRNQMQWQMRQQRDSLEQFVEKQNKPTLNLRGFNDGNQEEQ